MDLKKFFVVETDNSRLQTIIEWFVDQAVPKILNVNTSGMSREQVDDAYSKILRDLGTRLVLRYDSTNTSLSAEDDVEV